MRGGKIELRVEGVGIERLISAAARRGIPLWGVRRESSRATYMSLGAGDLLKLRPALRQTRCRVRVVKRSGAPFIAKKVIKRWVLAVGLLLALVGVVVATSVVWQVRVIGVEEGLQLSMAQTLIEKGASPGKFRSELDLRSLEAALRQAHPSLSWVGLRYEGVRLVAEGRTLVEPPDVYERGEPCDLIASCDALIERVTVFEGTAMVTPGQTVRKGDLLVAGIHTNNAGGERVRASAEVFARVWTQGDAEVPTALEIRVPTGRTLRRTSLSLLGFTLSAEKPVPFTTFSAHSHTHAIPGGLYLPIRYTATEHVEYDPVYEPLDPAECRAVASSLAFNDALLRVPASSELLSRTVSYTDLPGRILHATAYVESRLDIATESD